MIGATSTDFTLAHLAKIVHFAVVLFLPCYLHGNSAVRSCACLSFCVQRK